MRHNLGKQIEPLCGKIMVIVVAASLMLPVSETVLCIAPGSHVAIENLNAGCCASPRISTQEDFNPGIGLHAVDDCHNCTDIDFSANERGPVQKSYNSVEAGISTNECCVNWLPIMASSDLLLKEAFSLKDFAGSALSSVPLRC